MSAVTHIGRGPSSPAAVRASSLEAEKLAQRKARCDYCKTATRFVLSTIGLCVVVALYAVVGAFIFQTLEQTNEKEECIQAILSNFAYISNRYNCV